MIHKFTRQALYDLVWSQPMSKLAKNLGVSDVAVAKACRRAGIPVPGVGYWAKVQHGKKVGRESLSPRKPGSSDTVTITPLPSRSAPLLLPPDVQRSVDYEATVEAKIVVQRSLSNSHNIIQDWTRRAQHDISKTERRRLRILSTLFRELEKRGHSLVPDPNKPGNVAVRVDGETVEFWLKERQKQSRVELTLEEKRYSFGLNREWRYVLMPTGKLVFTIQSWLDSGMRRQWSDANRKPIEEQLNDIIVGLTIAGACLRRRRLEREEEERQRFEADRKRRELEAIKQQREQSLRRLTQRVHAWIQAGQIREYVAAARNAAQTGNYPGGPTDLEPRAAQALRLADEIDPLFSGDPLPE
jgi:hypothetical protein